jgi:hypothetical protein
VRRMRKVRWIVLAAALATLVPTGPANAASPQASCPGQELSALAPELGADLGAFISFEARNPELEGRKNFGEEIAEFATADRQNCPEE